MSGFDYDTTNMTLKCKRCGSMNVTVRPGMMADRAICNDCGNEDYI
jgi:formylmethanofuran dehydrogenase subunit E